MPYVDQIVLVLLAVGLLASIEYQWRRGLRGRALLATVVAMFYGVTLVTMLGFHCVDVLYGLARRLPSIEGSRMAYNWRTYSLLLFGATLVWIGLRCLRAALRVGRGDAAARAEFLRLALLVLAIVLPVIPLQRFFGYLMSGGSVVAILAVVAGARPAATPGTVAGSAD